MRLLAVVTAAFLAPARLQAAATPFLSDKELRTLGREIAAYSTGSAAGSPLSAAERAAVEKASASPLLEVRLGPAVTRAQAEGLKRFLAEVDVRTAPVRKIALGLGDCEAVDGGALQGSAHLVKTFDAALGYNGDWLYVPASLGEGAQVFGVLRYLHQMSLKTMEAGQAVEARIVGLIRASPRLRVYDVYRFSPKKTRLVHDGLSYFLPEEAEPLLSGRRADAPPGGRRGRPLLAPLGSEGGAPRPLGGEEPEGVCYLGFDAEAAGPEVSDRLNCLCLGRCGSRRADR